MNRRTRYFLIIIGIIFFAIAAPIIVLFVRGFVYDSENKKFVPTGILALKVEPKTTALFLDGKLIKKTAGQVRFLKPKVYEINLIKEGYESWTKKLEIQPSQVTWLNTGPDKIYLLLKNQTPKQLTNQALDFVLTRNNLLVLENQILYFYPFSGGQFTRSLALPLGVQTLQVSPDESFALATSKSGQSPVYLLIDLITGKITNLSPLAQAPWQANFDKYNKLFVLENRILYQIDSEKIQKDPVFRNVLGFEFVENEIFFLQNLNSNTKLSVSDLSLSNPRVLMNNLPIYKSADIFVSFQKQIFLLADNILFKVENGLEKISDNVSSAAFDQKNSSLLFVAGPELNYFSLQKQKTFLITRNEKPIFQPLLLADLGYAFFIKDNALTAIELDTRDRQNEYLLYSGEDIKRIFIDEQGKQAYFLDGQNLNSLPLR